MLNLERSAPTEKLTAEALHRGACEAFDAAGKMADDLLPLVERMAASDIRTSAAVLSVYMQTAQALSALATSKLALERARGNQA